ncbi:MAG: hypothetical protein IH944_09155 [Armatimonadetes bacterium]|nr:hypothetical protein [Armatimonadota bacterium]
MRVLKPGFIGTIVAIVITVLIFGCGGGGEGAGGGGGGGGGWGYTPEAGQYIEFVGISRSGNLDPLNLQVGDTVQLLLVNYDLQGNRTVMTVSGWFMNTANGPITLNATTGVFTVNSNPNRFVQFSINAFVSGQWIRVDQDSFYPTATSTVSGVVDEENIFFPGFGTGDGVIYAQIEFYDSIGNRVGAARVFGNGAFVAQIPTSVVKMGIKGSTIPLPKYFRSFRYLGELYSATGNSCSAPVGPMGAGANLLPDPVLVIQQASGPPPPPGGCG